MYNISNIEYPQPQSCQVLTHDFQRHRIAFTSAFRVHRPTSVSSNVVHFNMLKDQTLSAHYNAFRSVLLQDSTLKTKEIKYLSKYLGNLRKSTSCLQKNVSNICQNRGTFYNKYVKVSINQGHSNITMCNCANPEFRQNM